MEYCKDALVLTPVSVEELIFIELFVAADLVSEDDVKDVEENYDEERDPEQERQDPHFFIVFVDAVHSSETFCLICKVELHEECKYFHRSDKGN